MRNTMWLGIGLSAMLLAGCASVDSPAPAASAAVQPAAAATWPHERSDLPVDPNIRFGALPNGMRYAIMRNSTPPGAASLRLRFDIGSLAEAEDQRGVAHFVEHLALNETRNVPEGEFIRILERHGLQFGPDTNAMTSFDQTVYMLELPRAEPATVDTALFLMREAASEATLSQAVIDRERNVVLSEERTRATPSYRMVLDEFTALFPGDLLPNRFPIGSTDVIRNVTPERVRAFYDSYYRPERATLIAVGDFDVAEMETKIRARFSDWQGRGRAGAEVPSPVLQPRGVETRTFSEPGLPTRVTMSWVSPYDDGPDTRAKSFEQVRELLGLAVINRRLERLARGDNPPFIGGGFGRHHQGQRGEVVQGVAVARPGEWARALETIEQEQRRALEHGFTQAELDREIAEWRTALTSAAAGAATRTSPALAQSIVNNLNEQDVVQTPAQQLALFEEAVAAITPAQVHEATRRLFAGSGPLIYLATPTPVENGGAAVRTAFDRSRASPVAAPTAQAARTWPYQTFGTPGQVAERREIEGTGATAIRFANGVRLTVKPTEFRDDEILVTVRFGEGILGLSPDRTTPLWGFASGGFVQGGLGQLSYEELQEVLTGTVYSVAASASEDSFGLGGRTRPQDLALQMQVLAAYMTDPAWRPSGWERLRALSGSTHDQFETSPSGVFGRDSAALLRSGQRRYVTPSREEMAATTIADLRAVVGPAFANAPIEVIMVGDVSVDEAIRQTAATFGALPARSRVAPPNLDVRFPAGTTAERTHNGRADQALAFVAWPTTGFYSDQRRARALNVLSRVVQLRLLDEIRERQGAAYSPTASHTASQDVPDYGYLYALIETPPDLIEGFLRDASAIARDLRERPVTADELERARRPLVEQLQRARNSSNAWWLGQLGGVQEEPQRAESIRVGMEQYAAITPAELQALARQYLVDERAFRLLVRPSAAAGTP